MLNDWFTNKVVLLFIKDLHSFLQLFFLLRVNVQYQFNRKQQVKHKNNINLNKSEHTNKVK